MVLGLEAWFWNFTQMSQRALTPEVLADVPRPYLEMAIYGALKGGEVASVIGGLILHPLYRSYLTKTLKPEKTTPNSHKIIRKTCRRLQGRCLLAGLAIGPSLALLWSTTKTTSEVANTCYAIRRDSPMLTIDRCALCCGFIGWYWKRFQGAVDGVNIGLVYAGFNNKVLSKYTSPMMLDAIPEEKQFQSVESAAATRTKLELFLSKLEKEK